MDIIQQIIKKMIEDGIIEFQLKDECLAIELINSKCINALEQITKAVNNDSLDDFNCLYEIVEILISIGIYVSRHDFV